VITDYTLKHGFAMSIFRYSECSIISKFGAYYRSSCIWNVSLVEWHTACVVIYLVSMALYNMK